MNKIKLAVFIVVISVFLTSCITSSRYYTATHNPVPLFKQKGDLYIDLSTNMFSKADFTVGYAATNWLGGYIGVAGAHQKYTKVHGYGEYDMFYNNYEYKGTMLNGGLGYFLNPKNNKQLRFEVFGDFSLGNYYNKTKYHEEYHGSISPIITNFSDGNYHRIGILTNIGFTNKRKFLTFGYSAKLGILTFSNATFSNPAFGSIEQQRLNNKPNYQMLEHAIFGRIGKGSVKFQIQIGQYYCFNTYKSTGAVDQNNGSIIFGLVINPNIFSKK